MESMWLSPFDDRPGCAVSLLNLWDYVPAAEQLDVESMQLSPEEWCHLADRVARESHAGLSYDLVHPLGPVGIDYDPWDRNRARDRGQR